MILNLGNGVEFDLDNEDGMRQAAVWMDEKLASIPDSGSWLIPRSGSKYVVDHLKHTVTRVYGLFDEIAIERAIKAAGWTFTDTSVMK